MLVFPCPSCGANLQMPDDQAGKKVRCPSCQGVIVAPSAGATSEAISAAPAAPKRAAAPGTDEDDDDRPRRRDRGGAGGATAAAATAGISAGMAIALVVGGLMCLGGCGVVAVLVALLLPAVQKTREAAARVQTMNNMKQVALACHSYHDTFGSFPTPKEMMPPPPVELSWRVSILPFEEQVSLFNRFDRSKPWDSPQNQPLLNPMPPVYHHILRESPEKKGTTDTLFQYFTGPNTLWPENKKLKMFEITDGTSNTFLFAEAAAPVPWSKPADMAIQPNQPLPLPPDRFLVAFADGSTRVVDRKRIDEQGLRLYINPRDGQVPPPID